jgi:recA bacterial DNA recombination protein
LISTTKVVQNIFVGEQMANMALALMPRFQTDPKLPPLSAPAFNSLLQNGLQRGILAEINGVRSSGRTSAALHLLAQATHRGEVCAVIDLYDSFHPASAAAAGVALDRIVWVRCRGNAEHAMRAADLLLHAGGFGMVLLDLCDANARVLNRIPLSYWYRFRRAIENTPTIFLLCADTRQARSASVTVELRRERVRWSGKSPFRLLRAIEGAAVSKTDAVAPQPLSICSSA